ncbi:MAG: hypothetical protein U0R81_02820 [Mycobacterium sp.]
MAVKRKFKKASRAGAAAFAVGLYLAGPQVGVAVADGSGEVSSGSAVGAGGAGSGNGAGSGKSKSKSSSGSGVARVGSGGVDGGVGRGRSVGVEGSRSGVGRGGESGRPARVGGGRSEVSVRRSGGALGPAVVSGGGGVGSVVSAVVSESPSAAVDYAPVGGVVVGASRVAAASVAPRSLAAPGAGLPSVLANVDAQINASVVRVFSGLFNWVSTLPVNPVTNWLEGGLLLVRKSLFNQSASVNASQTVNNSLLVTGQIDVVDPEGDAWTIEVVGNPGLGTVVLGAVVQANGIGTVEYTYTPGPNTGYDGADSFVVKVSPAERVFNITDPFGVMDSRYYTVAVGDGAAGGNACGSCLPKDVLDTTLFLDNAGATVTVQRQGVLVPRYAATVTLSAFAANQAFAWMDVRGRMGSVSVDEMLVQGWSAFEDKAQQNAVKPLLAFSYSDAGLDRAVFIDVSEVTKNVDGTYQFSGELMANAPAQDGRVDVWDFLGIDYKAAYNRYLEVSGLGDCRSGQTCSSVSAVGILAATTLSPAAYVGVGGHDYQLPTASDAAATQLYPGSAGPVLPDAGLDTMIPWGSDGSFIVGESTGVIKLFTANAPTGSEPSWEMRVLKDFGWQSGAYSLATYNQVVTDAEGVPIPASVTGSVVNEGGRILTLSLANAVNPGTMIGQEISGEGISAGTVIDGFVSLNEGGTVTYTVSQAINAVGTITVTTPNIYQTQPGLIVGLADGRVEYWNGGGCAATVSGCGPDEIAVEGWTELSTYGAYSGWLPPNYGTLNTLTVLPNNQGIIAGTSTDSIHLWDSIVMPDGTIIPGPRAGAGCSNSSPSDCWAEVSPNFIGGSGVNVLIASGQDGDFVAGYNDGALIRWEDGGQTMNVLQQPLPLLSPAPNPVSNSVRTLTPYDQTTFIGTIGGAPAITEHGVISVPSYSAEVLSTSAVLAASTAGCESSYNSGSGAGCGGYVLTVQEARGNPIRVGQTLYGGAGLAPGTIITQQISDAEGNLCADSCAEGGAGIYLVNSSQLIAPGTPMSASDGSGFMAGYQSGMVQQWLPGAESPTELQGSGWGSSVNTAVGWRDGIVVSLDNGATFYWSRSNNPTGDVWDPDRLIYPGASVPSKSPQATNWSELQGTGWNNAAISMVPIGDGFAVGLSAPNPHHNGAIEMFTGFAPGAPTSAFGYRTGIYGPEPMTPLNSFTEVASQSALSGDASNGWVQQMIPVTGYVADDNGNLVLRQSLVAALSNGAIYAWTGSDLEMTQGTWTTLQEPGSGGTPTLTSDQLLEAWTYGSTVDPNAAWGAPDGVGATYVPGHLTPHGYVPPSGDPVFGLLGNQAWCGDNCASYGDYAPIVSYDQYGEDGSLYSIGESISANLDMSSVTYGYAFYPNSIISKFIPGKYSVGMVVAFQGGPSVNLNFPSYDPKREASEDIEVQGPRIGIFEPTLVGTFALDVGFKMGILASLGVDEPVDSLELAHAYYTPGLLYTWNAAGYRKHMSLSYSSFADVGYLSPSAVAAVLDSDVPLSVTPYVAPYIEASYGLFTPASTPLIGKWSVFDIGLGYQNPVGFTMTAPLNNLSDLEMSVTAEGFINAGVHFLPAITSSLSWDSKFQVYSVTNQTQPPGNMTV